MRVLTDRAPVKVFFDDGRHVHSQLVFPCPEDTGIELFTDGGGAVFSGVVIHEFGRNLME